MEHLIIAFVVFEILFFAGLFFYVRSMGSGIIDIEIDQDGLEHWSVVIKDSDRIQKKNKVIFDIRRKYVSYNED